MKYPVFICDDDQNQIEQTKKILGAAEMILSDDEEVEFSIATATNYMDAITYLKEHKLDGGIYFLDVELGGETENDTGFDLASLIKKRDERAQIIFVTSHADLSLITFRRRLGPIDYIVKTSDLDKLRHTMVKTIEVAIYNLHKFNYMKKMTFSYKIGRQTRNVNIDDIIYISTTVTPHKLLMILTTGEMQLLGSINQYAKENPMLEKINQSCLVNPKNIESIDLKQHRVQFINGDVEDFSRTSVQKMKDLLSEYNYKTETLAKNEEENGNFA
ncbi:LytR/AlgR family response regulator transcription factor [Lactobacillus crispatus]|uniref:LytTR family DNA-binding domain-containing protein n=1 Tax=Lactobacillus crispatus TaxID=47770 RepID=A0AAW6XKB2_9LACO|nr:LytTR family DNA-binding domain-containing protein [Lactobacillus crispatus]MDK6377937.1 LytTR family DNA-binding domain-containing protein [Lactobacillus crispatus]MDK6503312.1 LytTR family DNA-binding domain-containing protein [Lactobacillus crispatus]MDK8509682.1 LytTR family DNA-binding domain-containing protein [Lactobacillus crispatus]PLA29174.1 DNA-binding response regulator [Lactobacillus crispatus]